MTQKLFQVEVTTTFTMYVTAENDKEAQKVAHRYADHEAKNLSDRWDICHVTEATRKLVEKDMLGSLPLQPDRYWRRHYCRAMARTHGSSCRARTFAN